MAQKGTQAPRQPQKRAGEMNKTEARYVAEVLEPGKVRRHIRWWAYEAVTFKLGDGVRFTPDFLVLDSRGTLSAVEVKGRFIRDDATVKFKVAAGMYPWIRWVMTQYEAGEWHTLHDRPAQEGGA